MTTADIARPATSEISVLIQRWQEGNETARDALAARMLPELRLMAERALRRLDRPVSLHPSDLVQESVIKLLREGVDSNSASHLRALAAQVVRKTLIDYLRARHADKRGRRDTDNVSITVMNNLADDALSHVDLLDIHHAMQALTEHSPRAVRIVEMRVFGGMTEQEVADVLSVSRPTVSRDWATAKLWLTRHLSGIHPHENAPSERNA